MLYVLLLSLLHLVELLSAKRAGMAFAMSTVSSDTNASAPSMFPCWTCTSIVSSTYLTIHFMFLSIFVGFDFTSYRISCLTVVITWSYFSWWLLPCTPSVEAAAEAAERRGRRSSGLASSPSPSNDLTCLCCHSSFRHTPPSCDWPRIEKGGRSLVNAFPRQIQI